MNYRIPRAMCLAANYPVKNDPFLDIRVCVYVCVRVCVCVWGGEVDTDRLVSHHTGGQPCFLNACTHFSRRWLHIVTDDLFVYFVFRRAV